MINYLKFGDTIAGTLAWLMTRFSRTIYLVVKQYNISIEYEHPTEYPATVKVIKLSTTTRCQ